MVKNNVYQLGLRLKNKCHLFGFPAFCGKQIYALYEFQGKLMLSSISSFKHSFWSFICAAIWMLFIDLKIKGSWNDPGRHFDHKLSIWYSPRPKADNTSNWSSYPNKSAPASWIKIHIISGYSSFNITAFSSIILVHIRTLPWRFISSVPDMVRWLHSTQAAGSSWESIHLVHDLMAWPSEEKYSGISFGGTW